jgi:hypothetical protein
VSSLIVKIGMQLARSRNSFGKIPDSFLWMAFCHLRLLFNISPKEGFYRFEGFFFFYGRNSDSSKKMEKKG